MEEVGACPNCKSVMPDVWVRIDGTAECYVCLWTGYEDELNWTTVGPSYIPGGADVAGLGDSR